MIDDSLLLPPFSMLIHSQHEVVFVVTHEFTYKCFRINSSGENMASIVPSTFRAILKSFYRADARSIAMLEVEFGLHPFLSSMALQACERRGTKTSDRCPATLVESSMHFNRAKEAKRQPISFLHESREDCIKWQKGITTKLINICKDNLRYTEKSDGSRNAVLLTRVQQLIWLAKHIREITTLNYSLIKEITEDTDVQTYKSPGAISTWFCHHIPLRKRILDDLRSIETNHKDLPQGSENIGEVYHPKLFLPVKPKRTSKYYSFPFSTYVSLTGSEKDVSLIIPGYVFAPKELNEQRCVYPRQNALLPIVALYKQSSKCPESSTDKFVYPFHKKIDITKQLSGVFRNKCMKIAKRNYTEIDQYFDSIIEHLEKLRHPALKVTISGSKIGQIGETDQHRFRTTIKGDMLWNDNEIIQNEFQLHSTISSISIDECHLFAYGSSDEVIRHILNCGPSGEPLTVTKTSPSCSFDVTFSFTEQRATVRALLKVTAILNHKSHGNYEFPIPGENRPASGYLKDETLPLRGAQPPDSAPLYAIPFYVNVGPIIVR